MRLRFSLRTTLILMLVAGALLAAWQRLGDRARQVRTIEAAGGEVTYDVQKLPDPADIWAVPVNIQAVRDQALGRTWAADRRRVPPPSMHAWLSGDPFVEDEVAYVRFMAHPRASIEALRDEDLLRLAQFPALERLIFDHARQVTDRGVAVVAKLPRLTRLFLDGVPITDRGLTSIALCPSLEYLAVDSPLITDNGVAQLLALSQLESLSLGGERLTSRAISGFARLPKLSRLNLRIPVVDHQELRRAQRFMPTVELSVNHQRIRFAP